MERGLRAAGATLQDIVTLRLYMVDYRAEKAVAITEALHETFAGSPLPASTWIGDSALAHEDLLIEIEAIAALEEAEEE